MLQQDYTIATRKAYRMLGLYYLIEREIDRRNWSLRDLAAEAGISISTLSNIKNKDEYFPDLRTLSSLSSALGLPMRQLVEACGIPVEASVDDTNERISALVRSVPELQDFVAVLGSLTPDDRESILAHAESLVQRRQIKQK